MTRPGHNGAAAAQNTEEAGGTSPALRWRTVFGCIIAAGMTVLDLSMTSTALGSIQEGLHTSLAKGPLVISAYATAELVALALSAYLTRAMRPSTYLVVLTALFVVGALLAANAWSFESLLVARVVQGAASGAIMPFAYYVIVVLLPGDEHPKAISAFSISVACTYVLAPILCVTLGQWISWRALYCVAAPAGALALWLALPGLREMRTDASPLGSKVNLVSAAAVVVGLVGIQWALDSGQGRGWFASTAISLAVGVAVVAFAVFLRSELRGRNPLVDLRLLRLRPFLASCVFNVFAGGAIYSSMLLIPLYLTTLGYSIGGIGTISLYAGALQLAVTFGLPVALRWVNVLLVACAGTCLLALSALLPALVGPAPPYAVIVTALMARAAGSSVLLASLGLMATRALGPTQASSGSLLFNMSRSLGGSVGAALCAAFLAVREAHHLEAKGASMSATTGRYLGLHDVFAVAFVILAVLGIALLISFWRSTTRTRAACQE